MYESVYLYEKLKNQILEEKYVKAANYALESSYDIMEAQSNIQNTMKEIDEATENRKRNLLDKRSHNVVTAKKLLSKFKSTSTKTKPYGLAQKKFKKFKENAEIKKIYENSISYLNQFDPKTASETEVSLYLSDIKENAQLKCLYKILGCEKGFNKHIVVSDEFDKDIVKDDICEAVQILENEEAAYKKYDIIKTESVDFNNIKNRDRREAMLYKTALTKIAESVYYDMLTEKETMEFNQANRLVTKAAYYNPRNIKESYLDMNYIDSVFDFNEL